jgi:cytochrome c biogenesis protein ResB
MGEKGSQNAIGIIFIFTGLIVMAGAVTGNLAPMLAALFDPNILATNSVNKVGSSLDPASIANATPRGSNTAQ